jgi:hypothetical protein
MTRESRTRHQRQQALTIGFIVVKVKYNIFQALTHITIKDAIHKLSIVKLEYSH